MTTPISADDKSTFEYVSFDFRRPILSEELSNSLKKIDKEIFSIKKRIMDLEIHLSREFRSIKMMIFQAKIEKIDDRLQIRQLEIQNMIFMQKVQALQSKLQNMDQIVESLKTHRHDFTYLVIQFSDVSTKNGTTLPPKLSY
jgi:predicted  nucleic acid-binding Zn-ribbon protein